MTFNEAEIVFKLSHCRIGGLCRDEYEKYLEYVALNISKEQENQWRIEELVRIKAELDKDGILSSGSNMKMASLASICVVITDGYREVKEDVLNFLVDILKNKYYGKVRHLLICSQVIWIKELLPAINNRKLKTETKAVLLSILKELKNTKFDGQCENILESHVDYHEHLKQIIKDCKRL